MKNIYTFFILLALLTACSVKQTRKMVNTGNYDAAIQKSILKLRGDKNASSKQDYVYILEESFAKAKERDLRYISDLTKDFNPNNFEKIYNTYLQLNNRQERIRPLLPLNLINEGREAIFPFEDYSDGIISSKNVLSKFLYDNSKALISSNDKMSARKAYDDLIYLDNINPGYKETSKLLNEAQFKGTDFVYVNTKNETNLVIPSRLENDLLRFDTYGMNDKWTVYHTSKQQGINYDYGMVINFRQINISPEQIKEKEFTKEKQVKDGLKNLVDQRGNIVKDSLGHAIKVDNYKTLRIQIYEFSQIKSVQVIANVDFLNLKTLQHIKSFPVNSEFVFTNVYANYKGDKAACEESYYSTFDRRLVPFPSNEQMIYDTGTDLKSKIKAIITNNRFR